MMKRTLKRAKVITLAVALACGTPAFAKTSSRAMTSSPKQSGKEVPARKTYPLETKRAEFIRLAAAEARRLEAKYGIPALATLAMACHESGYGTSKLARFDNNFFGLKALGRWNGKKVIRHASDGLSAYRAYDSMAEGFYGFAQFIQQPRYKEAWRHKRDAITFVEELMDAGYCPNSDYMSNIRRVIRDGQLNRYL
jgi:flagellum-specific peptidoglycan hydrolase FlgJ